MKAYASRFGLLVDNGQYKSVVTGIECNLSKANETVMILNFTKGIFGSDDINVFVPLFNFHEAINEKR